MMNDRFSFCCLNLFPLKFEIKIQFGAGGLFSPMAFVCKRGREIDSPGNYVLG